MKYRIRLALICLAAGWYGSAFYYGFETQNTAQAAPPAQNIATLVAPVPLNVVCTFDFPQIPEPTDG